MKVHLERIRESYRINLFLLCSKLMYVNFYLHCIPEIVFIKNTNYILNLLVDTEKLSGLYSAIL